MISNGLGSFANLGGGYGLRLGVLDFDFEIKDDLNSDYTGITALFFSPSGEQVAYIQAGRGQGEKFEAKLNFRKYGNLDNFSIKIARANEMPIFDGMVVRFYYKYRAFSYGYVTGVPTTDKSGGEATIKGSGFARKLKDKKITYSAATQTINEIVEDIGELYFSDLGISYNASKNTAPSTLITTADWKNKSIEKVIRDLIAASNENFDTVEYIYGVDADGDFYFSGIQSDQPAAGFGEGFDYQNPKTEENGASITNRVEVYRTKETSEKETEYVNTFEDSESIDNNGIFEQKLTISDFVDNATAEIIADGIIQDNKNPKTRVSVQDLLIEQFIDFDFYILNNKKQEQKTVVSEFTSLSDWTQSLTVSSITIKNTQVFSGRQCYQWRSGVTSAGEYINKSVSYYNPSFLRLYLRQNAVGDYLQITIDGVQGDSLTNLVTNTDDNMVTAAGQDIKITALDTTAQKIQIIGAPTANEWIPVNVDLSGFFKVSNIKIEVIGTGEVLALLDRMEIYTDSYIRRNLSLQEITYEFGSSSVKATDAVFGQDRATLTEKLNKIDKKNTIAYDIFSKQ